jgi:predicted Zn-dependent protease
MQRRSAHSPHRPEMRPPIGWAAALLGLVCALFFLPALAAGLPDLGEASQADLSAREEQLLGDRLMQDIRQKDPAYLDDPPVADYLNQLGRRLTAQLDSSSRRHFVFFALNEPTINAFAMPGGYIGVHSGLLLEARSESELAGVLAHEISHVTQHHIARGVGIQNQSYATMLGALALAILAGRHNADIAQGTLLAGQAGAIQQQLNYSREYEREADRLGIALLERADFDIRGMERFFERLQRQARLYESKDAPAYLQTHPLTTERMADMNNRIQARPVHASTDSLDFALVRARLTAQWASLPDAYAQFKDQSRRNPDDLSARYGFALTLLRDNREREAAIPIESLQKAQANTPLLPLLFAQWHQRKNNSAAAITQLRSAQVRFPQSRAVVYALMDTLQAADQAAAALDIAIQDGRTHPDDVRVWYSRAKSYAALGQRFQSHRAQGEAYALQGLYPQAIEQFELARRAPDGDFFEHSQADARLRVLQQKQKDDRATLR